MAPTERSRERAFRAEAKLILEMLLGRGPDTLKSLAGGLTNVVLEARLGKDRFVLRMKAEPAKLEDYLKEHWVVDQAREAGVPTPEILQVGVGPEGTPYMVSRRAEGSEASGQSMNLDLIRKLGSVLKLVHTVRTSGYGVTFDWSRNALSRHASLAEFFTMEMKASERLSALASLDLITPHLRREAEAVLRELEQRDDAPVLNHGDPRLKNVLVSADGEIEALIDWECSTSSIGPEWDLSIALHDLAIDAKEALTEGYGLSPADVHDMRPVLWLLNLLHYAPLAKRAAETKEPAKLARMKARLSGAYNLF